MQVTKKILIMCAGALLTMPLMAQDQSDAEQRALEDAHRALGEAVLDSLAAEGSSEEALRQAEKRMEKAAQEIAELSNNRTSLIWSSESPRVMRGNRARLGVMVDARGTEGPVAGVNVSGVSPGGAAEQAGLEVGDEITAVNGVSFSAESSERARELLLGFMADVEVGDELTVDYLRDGKTTSVKVVAQEGPSLAEFFRQGRGPHLRSAPGAPGMHMNEFVMFGDDRGWGDMELVPLSKELGRYFGAEKGLLVIKAPGERSLQLQDGDVIQSIDGREPKSVHHAMRILGSYQSGEKLELKIMRDKKRAKISVEMPESSRGSGMHRAPGDDKRIIRKEIVIEPTKERT